MPAAPDNTASDSVATEPLGDVMSRVARTLQEEHGDVEATLRANTGSATRIVPNAEACGISYVTGRSKIEPRAWTSDLPKDVDSLQGRLKQGPCLDAVWDQPRDHERLRLALIRSSGEQAARLRPSTSIRCAPGRRRADGTGEDRVFVDRAGQAGQRPPGVLLVADEEPDAGGWLGSCVARWAHRGRRLRDAPFHGSPRRCPASS
jgi:hypothetical protein